MAARYSSGTATSPTDLLDKIVAFLALQGWTTHAHAVEGAGKRAHLSKNGIYANFRAVVNESYVFPTHSNTSTFFARTGIAMNLGTGYSAAASWVAQPGVASGLSTASNDAVGSLLTAGITFNYHIHDDGEDNIIIAAESNTTGYYAYWGFGASPRKLGNWTGGAYCFASDKASSNAMNNAVVPLSSSMSALIRATVDTTNNGWLGLSAASGRACVSSSVASTQYPNHSQLGAVGVSAMSGQANLLPLNILAARDGGGFSYIATLPNVFRCDAVGNGFSAGSTYTVGADSYVLFPSFAFKKLA